MDYLLIISIAVLSLVYILRLIKNKFKYEKRKEILLLQVIIFILLIITSVSGILLLYIPIALFVVILAICPERFYHLVSKYIK